MIKRMVLAASIGLGLTCAPVGARVVLEDDDSSVTGGGASALPTYLQCVPYAREVSGIQIHGDAWTWWDQAEGRYARGFAPRVGAVMALMPHGNSRLGHVAAVSKIIDSRTILIRHSNWSPINGRRGQIEDNVRAVDVSEANDWSAVRIWYAPIQALGGSHWPVQGFIYPKKPGKKDMQSRRPLPDWPGAARTGKGARSAAGSINDPIAAIIAKKMRW